MQEAEKRIREAEARNAGSAVRSAGKVTVAEREALQRGVLTHLRACTLCLCRVLLLQGPLAMLPCPMSLVLPATVSTGACCPLCEASCGNCCWFLLFLSFLQTWPRRASTLRTCPALPPGPSSCL